MKQLLAYLFASRRIFDKPLPFTVGQGRKGADALAELLKRTPISQKQNQTKTKKHNGNENN